MTWQLVPTLSATGIQLIILEYHPKQVILPDIFFHIETVQCPWKRDDALVFALCGPVLTELRDKLVAMGSDINSYDGSAGHAATDLLNSLTGVSTDLATFIANINTLIGNSTLSDADVVEVADLVYSKASMRPVRWVLCYSVEELSVEWIELIK